MKTKFIHSSSLLRHRAACVPLLTRVTHDLPRTGVVVLARRWLRFEEHETLASLTFGSNLSEHALML